MSMAEAGSDEAPAEENMEVDDKDQVTAEIFCILLWITRFLRWVTTTMVNNVLIATSSVPRRVGFNEY